MPRIARYALIAFGALIGLLLIVAGIVAATFNPNDYKPLIIKLVQEKKQRTLAIPGDIKLTFFPKIGADLGKLSISEHQGPAEFASMNSAKVSLALIPLLSKKLVVDRITVDGLHANIKRFKDGTTNFDDLVSKDEAAEQQPPEQKAAEQKISLDIDSAHISNASLSFDDRQKNRALEISGLNVDTGKIADGAKSSFDISAHVKNSSPVVDADLSAKSGFMIDTGQAHYVLDDLEAKIKGRLLDFTDADIRLAIPSFDGSPQAFKPADLKLDVVVKNAQLDAKAGISGTVSGDMEKSLFTSPKLSLVLSGKKDGQAIDGSLTTSLSADMKMQLIDLQSIGAAFTLPNPGGGALKLKADGRANVNFGKGALSAVLKGSLDDSAFDARFGMGEFGSSAYTFNIGIDHLDADRYQAKSATPATSAAVPEKPIDLSALKDLNANGSLRIGALKVENIKASNVRLELHAGGGKLDVNPLAAALYGGTANGSVSVTASNPPHFAMRQNLAGVGIGGLLKDAIGKDPIEGNGNLQLDVTTQGATVAQIKKGINGSAQLSVRDGAVNGINIAKAIREAKAKIGALKGGEAPQAGTASGSEKTDFSELSGSFRIANGVAHNDDLALKSPLIRVGGAGDIDLGEGRLDYLVKATVVSTLQGQGGPELQALKGLTVPVKLSGPFTAIGWKIDFAGMAGSMAKQKIDEKKEEVKSKLQDQLKDKLKGLFGK